MAYQHKPDTGSLFRNDKRESEKHPHAKGSALIDGVEYWVSAWTNDGKSGKYQSLKFSKKEENRTPRSDYQAPQEDFDDEIPF